jgi:hypothetical protein
MHPVELLGDVGHVESPFFLFGDSVSVGFWAYGKFSANRAPILH